MTWRIILTPQARAVLEAIGDQRVRGQIRDRINGLAQDPDKQGKALVGELAGYRSLRAVGQRYRFIYHVEAGQVVVLVVAVGIRKEGSKADIYALARKVLGLRLLERPPEYAISESPEATDGM
jgi:mRNA interferase RelE/StbE